VSDAHPNTTDATRGQPLRARIEHRKRELEDGVARREPGDAIRRDLEQALTRLASLLPADLSQIPHVTGKLLNDWLEGAKHLDEHHP
jgi:hypothetical protein